MSGAARLTAALASVALGGLLFGSSVSAHALHVASVPAAGAQVEVPPERVVVTFGEEPDPRLSRIEVLDDLGHPVTSGPSGTVPGQATQLQVPLLPLERGVYTVAWRTVSAVDGHLSTGSFAFGVGTPVPASAAATSSSTGDGGVSSLAASAVLGRWILFLGLSGLLGVAFICLVVTRGTSQTTLWFAGSSWLLACLGTAAVLTSEMTDAGVGLDRVMDTSLGTQVVERSMPLIIAAGALLVALRHRSASRSVLVILALGAALGMLADVLASHAAARGDAATAIVVQWLHFLAAGAWLGGLAAFLASLVGARPDPGTRITAGRFAKIGAMGLVLVAGTGVLRAIADIGSIEALVSSDFGHLVLAKTVLLALLAALGAINHFRNVPRAGTQLGGLRRVGSTEVLVALVVLFLAAALVNLAPPSAEAGTSQSPSAEPSRPPGIAIPDQRVDTQVMPGLPTIYTVHLVAGGTIQVYADPGTSGRNELHATFFDPAGLEAGVTSAGFDLRSEDAPAAGSPAVLEPRMLEPGHFVVDTDMPAGRYELIITGSAPDGSRPAAHIDLTVEP